eukprot:5268384-Amphidinium_carterae.1
MQADMRKRLPPPQEVSGTPAESSKRRRVRDNPKVMQFEPVDGHDSFETDELDRVQKALTEDAMNVEFRPLLQKIVGEHKLVDSHKHLWESGGKPDYFAAHCYTRKEGGADDPPVGVPALADSVTAVFQVQDVVLYDPLRWQLMVVRGEINTDKELVDIFTGQWSQQGALSFLRNKCRELEPPWEHRLTMCVEHSKAEVLGFLGKGGHGRVFHVRQGEEEYAMKVVTNVQKATTEVEMLASCIEQSLPVVTPQGEVQPLGDAVGYYLMQPVGKQITLKDGMDSSDLIEGIFEALACLHKNNVVHGDPRIQNIILHEAEGQLLWVDFMQTLKSMPSTQAADIRILCE